MVRNALEFLETSYVASPDSIAVIYKEEQYTYSQLYQAVNNAGANLFNAGAAGSAVVVYAEKGFRALVLMLGALKAGTFYVPIDSTVPLPRVKSILSTLDNALLIVDETTELLIEDLPALRVQDLLSVSQPVEMVDSQRVVLDTDPAYVLFTSGSTGIPKGVAVSHRALIDFIQNFVDTFTFESADRIANQAPFDFDVSVKDIYGSLAVGATLVIIPREYFVEPAKLVEYLDDHKVTNLTWAVAALCLVSGFKALELRPLSSVKRVMFSGEVMPLKHLKQWMNHLPQARFVNLYGPTEITCNCLYYQLERDRDYTETGIPLGGPFANREVLLVDEEGHEVTEPGQSGEIIVRGCSLALGYVGNPEQTAQVFVQNPLHNHYPDRVYKTGDLARISDSYEWFYNGRRDNQIKYQGHRIELEEIDATFEQVDGVTRCRCAYEPKRQRLYAFYEGTRDSDDITADVRKLIAAAMVPSKVIKVDQMPLTKNGKVDRKALLESVSRKRS